MMIGLYRHVIENDKITRSCSGSAMAPGCEIAGKTVGIIGMGAIGQRTALLAQAFGCRVIAWNRSPKQVDGVTFVDKETLLRELKRVDFPTFGRPTTATIGLAI